VVRATTACDGYERSLVSFVAGDGDSIDAFLFRPPGARASGGVVFLHQHASNWALGKSEVAGIAGDPLQAFGPALARAGVLVLAPDAVGFESRRGPGDDRLQYYNHAVYRLVRGELLMTKVLGDVAAAVTALGELGAARVGLAGHSHGGNITLFAAALDERVAFACASGAACSYRAKLAAGTGLEMALVIPGFAARFDVDDLLRCIAPRPTFVVSSDDDPYAADAGDLVTRARPAYLAAGNAGALHHLRTSGPHAIDAHRHDAIVAWLAARAARADDQAAEGPTPRMT
jgi:dienelactone hydrolase